MHPNEYVLVKRITLHSEPVIAEVSTSLNEQAEKLGPAYVEALREQGQRQLDALR